MNADVARHGPYNVSVQTGVTTAKVTWSPAFDSGHQLHHIVWYTRNCIHQNLVATGTIMRIIEQGTRLSRLKHAARIRALMTLSAARND